MTTAARMARLREWMLERDLNCMLIAQPDNRRYLTGFAAHDESPVSGAGWLVVGPDRATFVTTFLYYESVCESVTVAEPVRAPQFLEGIIEAVRAGGPGRIGFEANYLTYDVYQSLSRRLRRQQKLVPVTGLVEELRVIKDEEEIATIARAVDLTDRAYAHIVSLLRPGMTEREVAWEAERYMREHGAEGMAFEPAVAAGPHSAVPHHSPTDRPLQVGEPIWIDMGAKVDGYCGDLTRSFVLGQADKKFEEVMAVVMRALQAAEEGIRPGLTGREADALARDVIAAAGYGEAFGHSLGHGLGLQIHEAPRLSSRASEERLAAGMATTIEPGIYLPGWGGIRVEDTGVITPDGVRVLTRASKAWVIPV